MDSKFPTAIKTPLQWGEAALQLAFTQEFYVDERIQRLRAHQHVRSLHLRDESHVPRKRIEYFRPFTVAAVAGHVVGQNSASPCQSCQEGKGPFAECVICVGEFQGSCTNCIVEGLIDCCFKRKSFGKTEDLLIVANDIAKTVGGLRAGNTDGEIDVNNFRGMNHTVKHIGKGYNGLDKFKHTDNRVLDDGSIVTSRNMAESAFNTHSDHLEDEIIGGSQMLLDPRLFETPCYKDETIPGESIGTVLHQVNISEFNEAQNQGILISPNKQDAGEYDRIENSRSDICESYQKSDDKHEQRTESNLRSFRLEHDLDKRNGPAKKRQDLSRRSTDSAAGLTDGDIGRSDGGTRITNGGILNVSELADITRPMLKHYLYKTETSTTSCIGEWYGNLD